MSTPLTLLPESKSTPSGKVNVSPMINPSIAFPKLRTDVYYLPSFERDRRSALIGYG